HSPFDIESTAEEAAARIRAAELAGHLVMALDEWAFAAFVLKQTPLQEHLLRIAQLADPDPSWRDRFRTPPAWHDREPLLRLPGDALKTATPPTARQLSITGILLRKLGEKHDDKFLLLQALSDRPSDFWLNWELASALTATKQYAEAVEYYRVA